MLLALYSCKKEYLENEVVSTEPGLSSTPPETQNQDTLAGPNLEVTFLSNLGDSFSLIYDHSGRVLVDKNPDYTITYKYFGSDLIPSSYRLTGFDETSTIYERIGKDTLKETYYGIVIYRHTYVLNAQRFPLFDLNGDKKWHYKHGELKHLIDGGDSIVLDYNAMSQIENHQVYQNNVKSRERHYSYNEQRLIGYAEVDMNGDTLSSVAFNYSNEGGISEIYKNKELRFKVRGLIPFHAVNLNPHNYYRLPLSTPGGLIGRF